MGAPRSDVGDRLRPSLAWAHGISRESLLPLLGAEPMTAAPPQAACEAARVAQVGYTAVIDRMTPALDHAVVAANVARSVAGAGGAPAASAPVAAAWSPAWRDGAVSLFDERRTEGAFGTAGTLAFGITVEAGGAVGALAATAVLHEPSAQLRADAAALSTALHALIGAIRVGAVLRDLVDAFASSVEGVSAPVELVTLSFDGPAARVLAPETVIEESVTLGIGAIARSTDGPIALQTTIHVSAAGAERLDAFPLRLIELR